MQLNEIQFMFTPYWMNNLTEDERGEVQHWLKSIGVDLLLCPGFDLDPVGKLVTTRYYHLMDDGTPEIRDDLVVYEDQVREFSIKAIPDVVARSWSSWKGY